MPQIKRLRKRVNKLRCRTQEWEAKRVEAHDSFVRIRDRAALGYKKKQLLDMVKDLRAQLKNKRNKIALLKETRHKLQVCVCACV